MCDGLVEIGDVDCTAESFVLITVQRYDVPDIATEGVPRLTYMLDVQHRRLTIKSTHPEDLSAIGWQIVEGGLMQSPMNNPWPA